jgi:hypothetical protein
MGKLKKWIKERKLEQVAGAIGIGLPGLATKAKKDEEGKTNFDKYGLDIFGKKKRAAEEQARMESQLEKDQQKQLDVIADRTIVYDKSKDKADKLIENQPTLGGLKQLSDQYAKLYNDYALKTTNSASISATQSFNAANRYLTEAEKRYGESRGQIIPNLEKGGNEMVDMYKQALGTTQQYRQQGYDTLQGGLNTAVDATRTGATDYLNTIRENYGKSLDIYRGQAARTTIPGQALMEEGISRNSANALRSVKDLGGSGGSKLSAIADVYANQQAGLKDIALQASAYRDANKTKLADEYKTYGSGVGEAQLTSSQAISNAERDRAMQLSGYSERSGEVISEAQKQVGDISYLRGADMANAYQGLAQQDVNYGQSMSTATQNMYANRLNTIQGGRDAALMARNQAISETERLKILGYNVNQLSPWQNQQKYYTDEAARLDPFNATMGVYGNSAANNANMYMNSMDMTARNNEQQSQNAQAWGQVAGSLMMEYFKSRAGS